MSDVTRILTAIEQGNAKATDQLLCSVAACFFLEPAHHGLNPQ